MALYSYTYQKQPAITIPHSQRLTNILIHTLAASFSLFLVLLSTLLINNYNSSFASPISGNSQMKESGSVKQLNKESLILTPTSYRLTNGRGQDGNYIQPPTPAISTNSNPLRPSSSEASRFQPVSTKSLYTIAVIGDSMVDTMGEVLEYLDEALKNKYPDNKFLLYNYGTGAQNVETGLTRFASHFKYQSRDYPALPELKPDILIVASFAYNPFTPHDRDRHWLTLTQLVQQAQTVSNNVYLLAEIAPLRRDFGKGPQGVNWSDDTNFEHSGRIIEQLQNTVGLSSTLGVPLIDAFTPSLASSQEGRREYVNSADGIHASVEGHRFMAEIIADAIILP